MSASSSHLVEMPSNSSSAETENSITDGHAANNVIVSKVTSKPQRKRRLPNPPSIPPWRPIKNSSLCWQSCKKLCSYCVGSRLILSIPLVVLALAGLGVVIYMLVSYEKVPLPPPSTPPPEMNITDGVPEGSNGTLKFVMSPVQNPDGLNLFQESIGQNVTILQNVKLNFTNGTWSFDGREISIGISISDKRYFYIVLNMDISNSQCRHAGKYFVLISGSNGNVEKSLFYNVTAACPCESEYALNSGGTLKCELKVRGNTTVSFNQVRGEIIKPILYQTGIRIPDDVLERGRFSARWNRNGTLTTRINFSPVQCQDEGNYSLIVTSRLGTQLRYMYVKVIDKPLVPTISIPKGLIQDVDNALQCQASTGCKNASLRVEATQDGRRDYFPWQTNLTSTQYPEGYLWKANATLTLTKYMVNNLQKRCFRCTYSIGGRPYYSQPICIKIIPAVFCKDNLSQRTYPHPYDCTKYITCTTDIFESTCPAGLHYFENLGKCDYPDKANCNKGLLDDCDCQDT